MPNTSPRTNAETHGRRACVVSHNHVASFVFSKRGVRIFKCESCGCLMADTSFVPEQYEETAYYTMAYDSAADIEAEWGFRWRYILRSIRALHNGDALLDIGAGNGYFVSLAEKEFGYSAVGVEISSAEIDFAHKMFGVDLERGDVGSISEEFSVVTSFNVIEHVENPVKFFTEMVDRTEPGGLVVVTTPNPGCIHRHISGLRNWQMVDPPHHINLLSYDAMLELGARRNLELLSYSTLSTYIRSLRRFDTSNLIVRRTAFRLLQMTNLGADHFFIFRKPPQKARFAS
jgi:2-polyprenyl-3-methyl-5-hydroxy-6-metoxy-1,4-benzoquinol methylase